MPSYDFSCTNCDKVFEKTVSYDMRLYEKCYDCNARTKIVWRKSQKPMLFREDNYQIEFGDRAGTRCSSRRKLLDEIKYANDRNPNPVELASEYYG